MPRKKKSKHVSQPGGKFDAPVVLAPALEDDAASERAIEAAQNDLADAADAAGASPDASAVAAAVASVLPVEPVLAGDAPAVAAAPPQRGRPRLSDDERRAREKARQARYNAQRRAQKPVGDPIFPGLAAGPGLSGPITDSDPAKRAAKAERALATAQSENATLRARLDTQTHQMVKTALAGLIVLGGKLLARPRGPDTGGDHFLVSVADATEAGEHIGTALIPFLGDMSKYAPVVVAMGAVAALVMPRAEYEAEIAIGRRQRTFSGVPLANVALNPDPTHAVPADAPAVNDP